MDDVGRGATAGRTRTKAVVLPVGRDARGPRNSYIPVAIASARRGNVKGGFMR